MTPLHSSPALTRPMRLSGVGSAKLAQWKIHGMRYTVTKAIRACRAVSTTRVATRSNSVDQAYRNAASCLRLANSRGERAAPFEGAIT